MTETELRDSTNRIIEVFRVATFDWILVAAGQAVLSGLALLWLIIMLGGCAFTSIETPIGKYISTRDSSLDSLEIQIIEHADGRKETIVKVGGASGQASPVVQAQAEVLRAAMEAVFALGKAAP